MSKKKKEEILRIEVMMKRRNVMLWRKMAVRYDKYSALFVQSYLFIQF